jgi:uncharacterized protein YjbI with pentapeptide repeats
MTGVELRRRYLAGERDFSQTDFTQQNLSSQDLRSAIFRHCTLSHVDLVGASSMPSCAAQ